MERMKLTVNETKPHVCRVPEESFGFLGYTIGRCWSPKTGKSYIGTRPSKERIQRICREISEATAARTTLADEHAKARELNRVMNGWANYFRLAQVSKARRAVDMHARIRLRQWLRRKDKIAGAGIARYPDQYLYRILGLVRLEQVPRPELHVPNLP